jgi:redox-sensitive bicupin YhaK (pirin superfamily)
LQRTAHRQREGAGFIVRRPFPTYGLDQVDPFLMLDELGPVDYAPGEAVGAPDHPHRGFETVSYFIEGEGEHEDSVGNRGIIGAGAVPRERASCTRRCPRAASWRRVAGFMASSSG